MLNGVQKRVVSMWFHRLPSDRILRAHPVSGPFALTLNKNNADRLYCLNTVAEKQGLHRGMPFADAKAFCPDLLSLPAAPEADQRFLGILRRWATKYCPWVGLDGEDGLVLDISGSAHLLGGEDNMLAHMRHSLARAGLSVRLGAADTRGAAWALAHYGEGICPPGKAASHLADFPVAALRLEPATIIALQRLGLRKVGDLAGAARPPLARRFGPSLLYQLDRALGLQAEPVAPVSEPPHYGVRITLPDPVGLTDDVMALARRLLERLCQKLDAHQTGAQKFCLSLCRVDQETKHVALRLARPSRDPKQILSFLERDICEVDAGFGIDQLRLEAMEIADLAPQQTSSMSVGRSSQLDDLISRIGTRIGLDNIHRLKPESTHIPERSFSLTTATTTHPEGGWSPSRPRPIRLFRPEAIQAEGSQPPAHFQWRRRDFTTVRVTGPERIAPEWWRADDSWRSGIRDYWKVDTRQGQRLWLFHTPQQPGWFVQGEFA